MGVVRFLLALSVVIAHTPFRNVMTGGPTSVQAFYAISGFYMALVLDRNPHYSSWRVFYLSRLRRLFPVYWIVAILTLAAFCLTGDNFYGDLSEWVHLPIAAKSVLAVSNAIIVFQDAVFFLGVNGGVLKAVGSAFDESKPPLYHFLLVGQAWSISVELVFYAFAPLLARRSTVALATLCIGSLCLRVVASNFGFAEDPWTYRFWPFEIAVFVLGMLAYRAYKRGIGRGNSWAVPFVLCLTVAFPYIPLARPVVIVIYLGTVIALLPAMFVASFESRLDRRLGDLTYPLYLVHPLALAVCFYCCGRVGFDYHRDSWVPAVAIPLTLVPAYCLHRWCVDPLERSRKFRTEQIGLADS